MSGYKQNAIFADMKYENLQSTILESQPNNIYTSNKTNYADFFLFSYRLCLNFIFDRSLNISPLSMSFKINYVIPFSFIFDST